MILNIFLFIIIAFVTLVALFFITIFVLFKVILDAYDESYERIKK